MSTFTTYNTLIEQRLANQSETFYESSMKRLQCNKAIEDLLNRYDFPDMIKTGTLAFTSGNAAKPSDYFKMVKLWIVDSDGVETNEYVYKEPADFDQLGVNDSYYWTEDYVAADVERRILIKPNDTTTPNIRYVKKNTTMEDDSTDSGLTSRWDEAVALWTCFRLLKNAGELNEADLIRVEAIEVIKATYTAVKNPGGYRAGRRFVSIYRNRDYLNQ